MNACGARRADIVKHHGVNPSKIPIVGGSGDYWISRHFPPSEFSQYIVRTYVRVNLVVRENPRET